MISDKKLVQYFVFLCEQYSIEHVIFSPGSRNAPLVLSMTSNAHFSCKVIVDERSAAFIALGMAQQKGEPVMICCTSGSAALNYAPAIAEAYYQKIPLLVVTADRPAMWINQGDGQAIDQQNIFSNYCKASYHVEDIDNEEHYVSSLDTAFFNLKSGIAGPIHVNMAFDEPLYGKVVENSFDDQKKSFLLDEPSRMNNQRIISLAACWNGSERIMIICGAMPPDEKLKYQLQQLKEDPRVIILTETPSNQSDFQYINCIDRTLERINEEEKYHPKLIITLGDAIVSKRIKAYLRKIEKAMHWHIQESDTAPDVFLKNPEVFDVPPSHFFNSLIPHITFNTDSQFKNNWLSQSFLAKENHLNYLKNIPWCDLTVFHILNETLPESINLHLSNSSPVRYNQLFEPIASIQYSSNRGVSGIDGCISTAIGASLVNQKTTICISGDLGFGYDSNAFWNSYSNANSKVIVINNGGGGIFRIIPGPDTTNALEEFFEVGNAMNIAAFCKVHNLNYLHANDSKTLEEKLPQFYSPSGNNRPTILEVFTPKETNALVLRGYFKAMKA